MKQSAGSARVAAPVPSSPACASAQEALTASQTIATGPSGRLRSLDLMRGFTIAAMILVNNNGDARVAYWPLLHSRWNGCTPTDIVFPAFLFMVGMSLQLSFRARLRRGWAKTALFKSTLRRALWLFLLGLLVNGFPYFDLFTLRIPGVLQRIALCSIVTAALILCSGRRVVTATAIGLLVGYWLLLVYTRVPDFGVPAQRHMLLDPRSNLAAWLDRRLFPGHLYRDGSYDPEGLLSTLPAIANTLFGSLAAFELMSPGTSRRKLIVLLASGLACVGVACCWSHWLPFNKRLWTSSYALLASGIAYFLLTFCYWLVDLTRRNGSWLLFFEIFGTNAIFAYLFSELLASSLDDLRVHVSAGTLSFKQGVAGVLIQNAPTPAFGSLLYSLLFVLVCFCATWLLYRKRIFLKL